MVKLPRKDQRAAMVAEDGSPHPGTFAFTSVRGTGQTWAAVMVLGGPAIDTGLSSSRVESSGEKQGRGELPPGNGASVLRKDVRQEEPQVSARRRHCGESSRSVLAWSLISSHSRHDQLRNPQYVARSVFSAPTTGLLILSELSPDSSVKASSQRFKVLEAASDLRSTNSFRS